ncbi:MAG: DUF2975 domain-containing protein [Janthinobacterium lividum]
MSHGVIAGLRACIVVVLLGAVLVQAAVVPSYAADNARAFPEVAYLRWPYTVVADGAVGCVQVALLMIWALLTMVSYGEIFTDRAFRRVDVIIGAGVVATLLSTGVWLHLFVIVGQGGLGALFFASAAFVAGAGFVLLMVVMRSLLRSATVLRNELSEVV